MFDASVILSWAFHDEESHIADIARSRLLVAEIVIPSHCPVEIVNGLVIAGRQGRLSVEKTFTFLAMLNRSQINIDPLSWTSALFETITLAHSYQLTAYDAAYLELARRLHCPLATLDKALRTACKKEGVTLLDQSSEE